MHRTAGAHGDRCGHAAGIKRMPWWGRVVAVARPMIRNIQALRAIAALMVVFVHVSGLLGTLHLPVFGAGGVDLFFLISGFVMVHTTRLSPPGPGAFLRNRALRIVPVYWLATILVYVASTAIPGLVRDTGDYNLVNLVKSLLFIPYEKSNGVMRPILFVGWTLNLEMVFYLLFAIGLAVRHYRVGLGGVLVVLGALALTGLILPVDGTLLGFYTNPGILEFGLGMGAALVTTWIARPGQAWCPALAVATVLGLTLVVVAPLAWPSPPYLLTAGLPAFGVTIGAVLLERGAWTVTNRLVLAIGDASFVLYLTHPYVTEMVEKLTRRYHPTGWLSIGMLVLTVMALAGVAITAHHLVERPLQRLMRHWVAVKRLRPRPV